MITALAAMAVLFVPTEARAQGAELPPLMQNLPTMSEGVYGVGVGVGVGHTAGFNFALRTEQLHTFSSLTGWELSENRAHIHGDYQIPFAEVSPADTVLAVTLYAGVGVTMDIDQTLSFGARLPIAGAISFDKPAEVFLELVPLVGVLPDVDMGLQSTLGLRGWFRPKPSNSDGLEVGRE